MKIVGKILLALSVITLMTSGRCTGVAKLTKQIEKGVNKSTKVTEKAINPKLQQLIEQSKKPNVQRGAAYGGYRAVNNAARSNGQTSSQPRMINCSKCYGRGSVQGNDGYVYSCSRCNGTGKIFTK